MIKIKFKLSHNKNKLNNQAIGYLGESIVAACLKKRGYQILGRNIRTRFGEIDLIACKNRTVFFVEVKTRRHNYCGLPEESVTAKKLSNLTRSCLVLVAEYARTSDWSILIVGVELSLVARQAVLRATYL